MDALTMYIAFLIGTFVYVASSGVWASLRFRKWPASGLYDMGDKLIAGFVLFVDGAAVALAAGLGIFLAPLF